MAAFGKNLRLNVLTSRRDEVRRFWQDGLGCARREPRPGVDLFDFDDGGMIGVFYGDAALPDDAWDLAPWLEFAVDDPAAVAARLRALGGRPVANALTDHVYLLAPGGPIFRLAPR